MARRKKAEPPKRSAILAPLRAALLSEASLGTIDRFAVYRTAPRDRVHYYKDGQRYTVGLDHAVPS